MYPADTFDDWLSPAYWDSHETKAASTNQERRSEELQLEKLKVRLAEQLARQPQAA
jgi:hypothetical protein